MFSFWPSSSKILKPITIISANNYYDDNYMSDTHIFKSADYRISGRTGLRAHAQL